MSDGSTNSPEWPPQDKGGAEPDAKEEQTGPDTASRGESTSRELPDAVQALAGHQDAVDAEALGTEKLRDEFDPARPEATRERKPLDFAQYVTEGAEGPELDLDKFIEAVGQRAKEASVSYADLDLMQRIDVHDESGKVTNMTTAEHLLGRDVLGAMGAMKEDGTVDEAVLRKLQDEKQLLKWMAVADASRDIEAYKATLGEGKHAPEFSDELRGSIIEAIAKMPAGNSEGEAQPEAGLTAEQPGQNPEEKRSEVLAQLQAEFLEKAEAKAREEGTTYNPEESKKAFEAHIETLTSETDKDKIGDARDVLDIKKNEIDVIFTADRAKEIVSIADERLRRKIIEKVESLGLPAEMKEQAVDLITKLQNSSGSVSEAEVVEAAAKLPIPDFMLKTLLKKLGGLEGDRLNELASKIIEYKKNKGEVDGLAAEDPTTAPLSEDASITAEQADQEMKATEAEVEKLVKRHEAGEDVSEEAKKATEKTEKNKKFFLKRGAFWKWFGIVVLLVLVAGVFGALSVHGSKKK